MSDLLAPNDHRNGKKHDEDVDASLGAEGVDVAGLVDPGDDAVEEAEGDDVLGDESVEGDGGLKRGLQSTFRPTTSVRASALTGR